MTKTIQAFLLHKQWSGDTSAKVYFLTSELGLLPCVYRGGRTPKKQALLQAFAPLIVSVEQKYHQYYVRSIDSLAPVLPLEGAALFSGLYLNELLYYVLSPDAPDFELFQAYSMALEGLVCASTSLALESLLRRFEWTLLKTCGYSFSLTHEVNGQVLHTGAYYQFIGEGLVRAPQGIPGEHLLALAQDNLNNTAYLKSAKILMRQAIDQLLGGRKIKTRSLYLQ